MLSLLNQLRANSKARNSGDQSQQILSSGTGSLKGTQIMLNPRWLNDFCRYLTRPMYQVEWLTSSLETATTWPSTLPNTRMCSPSGTTVEARRLPSLWNTHLPTAWRGHGWIMDSDHIETGTLMYRALGRSSCIMPHRSRMYGFRWETCTPTSTAWHSNKTTVLLH